AKNGVRRADSPGGGSGARRQPGPFRPGQDPRHRDRARSAGRAPASGRTALGPAHRQPQPPRGRRIAALQPGDEARLLRALDMGVNDYLTRPIDRNELLARVRTQIRRKRHSDYLRDRLEETVELAVRDPLTGLHNRRYMETHLKALAEQAGTSDRPLSVV